MAAAAETGNVLEVNMTVNQDGGVGKVFQAKLRGGEMVTIKLDYAPAKADAASPQISIAGSLASEDAPDAAYAMRATLDAMLLYVIHVDRFLALSTTIIKEKGVVFDMPQAFRTFTGRIATHKHP